METGMRTALETMLNLLAGGLAITLCFVLVSFVMAALLGFRDAWHDRDVMTYYDTRRDD
jgi:hypothetical protein